LQEGTPVFAFTFCLGGPLKATPISPATLFFNALQAICGSPFAE
jgi:hypothetical protein